MVTIGHGAMQIESFLEALKEQATEYLIDVRSVPQSRFHPQFNRKALEASLSTAGIHYLHWGKELGGRPSGAHYYHADGRVNYEAIQQSSHYTMAIERLVKAEAMKINVALMCSETNPAHCHRSKLIGESLSARGIELRHICKGNPTKSQGEVMCECRGGMPKLDLFGQPFTYSSVKTYPKVLSAG
jgi:uncharacterized protein (DUF488 family)